MIIHDSKLNCLKELAILNLMSVKFQELIKLI